MADIVNNAIRARLSGFDEMQGITENIARKRAGRQMAADNLSGAADELYGAGMVDAGLGLERVGEQREDRAKDEADRMKAQQDARAKEQLAFMVRGAQILQRIPKAQRQQAYLENIAPTLKAMGADDETIQTAAQHLDDNSLRTFTGQAEEAAKRYTLAQGTRLVDENGNVIAEAPFKPEYRTIRENETLVQVGGEGGARGGAGSFEDAIEGLMQREGGFVSRDGRSGAPANFGINQRANPDIDVRNLTRDQAKQLYKDRYWDAIGADQIPQNAREAVFDAAVNQGVQAAQAMWQQSGGDLQRFNELRLRRYRNTPGYDQYGQVWERRVAETGGGGVGGPRVVARGGSTQIRSATPEELAEQGYPPGTRAQVDSKGELKNIKQPTEAQTKASGYTYRVLRANDQMNDLGSKGIWKPSAQLLISEKNGVTRIVASNPNDRQFIQAAKNWLAPILRKDTGAAVTDQELMTYMDIYIPRPEDDIQTIRQKAQARQDAMVALAGEARGVYGATHGDRKFRTLMPSATRTRGGGGDTFDTPDGRVTVRAR